jgi:hypothetical protein
MGNRSIDERPRSSSPLSHRLADPATHLTPWVPGQPYESEDGGWKGVMVDGCHGEHHWLNVAQNLDTRRPLRRTTIHPPSSSRGEASVANGHTPQLAGLS